MRSLLLLAVLLLVACTAPPPPADPPAGSTTEPAPAPTELPAGAAQAPALTETPAPSSTRTEDASPTVIATTTATALLPPSPSVAPTPEPERVRVTSNGSQSVNLRREPGTDEPVVKAVPDGAIVTVVGTDREVDGRLWRNVQDGDDAGWIVATALRPLPTPTATPTAAASPGADGTPTPGGQATGTPATASPSATPTPPPPTATPGSERAEVVGTDGQGVNLRADPGIAGRVLDTLGEGTHLTVVGPDQEVDGRTWRQVRTEDGATGWIVREVLRSLATATPTATPTATSSPSATAAASATAATAATDAGTPTPPAADASTATPTPGAPSDAGTPTPPTAEGTPTVTPGSAEGEPPLAASEPTPEPERVEVYGTGTQGANLRAQPGLSGTVLQSVPDGMHLTVVGEDSVVAGVIWRNVRTDDNVTGWLANEVIRTLVTPTPTPRPGAPGIGAPIAETPEPEEQQTEEERAATPCRPGQLKGDAETGIYYLPDHPEYAGLLQRVRCFDDASRARASGFLPADPPEAAPSPGPE